MLCFKNLPVELCEEILSIAAWDAYESDRPWLLALATTSQRILTIVRVILYNTVHITWKRLSLDRTVRRILAAAPAGHFGLTRYLWVDIHPEEWDKHRLAMVFPNVVHLAAESLALLAHAPPTFRPQRLTLLGVSKGDWNIFLGSSDLPTLRGITHLRLSIRTHFGAPEVLRLATLSPELCLQYVILESRTVGWHAADLCGAVIPFFLSGASMRRLSICATTYPMPEVCAALEMYAKEHRERRLWLLESFEEGAAPSTSMNSRTFDVAQWTNGRPLYDESEP